MGNFFVSLFFVLVGLVFLLLVVVLPTVYIRGWHHETSRGEHTGFITAVEKTGVFFKTGRAYLKTDTQSSQEDSYCVMDQAVYDQLQDYSKSKTHVNVYFFSWISAGITNCDDEDAIIYQVTPLAN